MFSSRYLSHQVMLISYPKAMLSLLGEKPEFLGIREQRVTGIMIAVCIGLSTLITPVLGLIPMPVLFGVFLFMGVQSLKGLQFFDRCHFAEAFANTDVTPLKCSF